MENITDATSPIMTTLADIFTSNPDFAVFYTTIMRYVFIVLALFILIKPIKSLLSAKNPSEIWAYLRLPDGSNTPIKHWENVIGRHSSCDVIIKFMSVSRNHGTLIRDEYANWYYNDLGSKGGSKVNGHQVVGQTLIKAGDTITIAGADMIFVPASLQEKLDNLQVRKQNTTMLSPWMSLIALTILQILLLIQLIISKGNELPTIVPATFCIFTALMWGYCIFMKTMRRGAFEMETIAFFLCTLNLAVTATSAPGELFKQVTAIALGVGAFFALCWFLRDLEHARNIRKFLIIISVVLLLVNIVFGTTTYGAQNWIHLGGLSIQPSEIIKITFIFIGAATLDELYERKNLILFIGFSGFCLAMLALMSDFGSAAIFFVTFLVISFMRSGDFSKLILVIGGAVAAGLMVLRFRPYVADRFSTWMHAWDDPYGVGFQQTRAMSASSSGGMIGDGVGAGWYGNGTVPAANTDLVFGILVEEWGLIIAIFSVLAIVALGIFAIKSIQAARSTFYTIAACAATTMFVFQSILNIFGTVDLLPLTGVTLPFVSVGGTSMIASWGLLAFLKAADTRQNASIAVKGKVNADMEGGRV
ncbi:MAG: FtsW/RodA/SpoVE family cell cycle protein [Anaerovoracaceae bacterium]